MVAYGVAAVDDVIDRPFKLETQLPCHGADRSNLSSREPELQNSGPDPRPPHNLMWLSAKPFLQSRRWLHR